MAYVILALQPPPIEMPTISPVDLFSMGIWIVIICVVGLIVAAWIGPGERP